MAAWSQNSMTYPIMYLLFFHYWHIWTVKPLYNLEVFLTNSLPQWHLDKGYTKQLLLTPGIEITPHESIEYILQVVYSDKNKVYEKKFKFVILTGFNNWPCNWESCHAGYLSRTMNKRRLRRWISIDFKVFIWLGRITMVAVYNVTMVIL